MRTPTGLAHSPSTRQGFSLVELLVVITIIAILAALSTAAVFRVRGAAKRTAVVSDISNMNTACSKFKQDFGFNVPQVFTFPTHVPNPGVTSAANDAGFAVFKSMFRAYAGSLAPGAQLPDIQFGSKPKVNGTTITGSQCLLFFLGGPNLQGFDPTGPASPAGNAKKGPYMDFDLGRIDVGTNNFLDSWGTPYAMFSSGRSDKYDGSTPLTYVGIKMLPFQDASKKWVNPGGVQIISAGPDQQFGSTLVGSTMVLWEPEKSPYATGEPGADDIGNFNNGLPLGQSGK